MATAGKVVTKASVEKMRWADDKEEVIRRQPTDEGNDFDIRMVNEADGYKAAKSVVGRLKDSGLCLVEANAPKELLLSAYEEAEELWEDGVFTPPLRVHDDRSMMEARSWQQALSDEDKVVWLRPTEPAVQHKNALKLLANNLSDFGSGLGDILRRETGISFDRHGHAMLSCYTGDKTYSLHLDNSHAEEEDDRGPIDNGMRLTMVYFLNPHWDGSEGYQGGGMDVYLTDPLTTPLSSALAKKSAKHRIAPHADTLAVFLSERMAHQMIQTKGKDHWFAITMWCIDGVAMEQMSRKIMARNRRMQQAAKDSDDED